MFGEFPFLTLFFRILNAVVLFGLVYYLYRRFFKYRIEEKINQKEALLKGLEEQGHALEGRAVFLQRQIHWQQERVSSIESKIDEWGAAVAAAQNRRRQELAQFAHRAAERVEIKNNTIAQNHWQQAVMPRALQEAQKDLEKEFSDHALNQSYITTQIQKLSERQ
jgi:chaperonin cofactor prefoldin